jgi:DNA-binding transcriptional LysR family regulator
VQLVLTDRILLTQDLRGGIVSHHIWRFADLSTRLEFLLAGFGWCNMPLHMVRGPIEQGRLKALKARGARRVPVPRPYRACARARDRPRRALAHRDLRVRMAGG